MNLLSENCVDLINFAVPILLSNTNTDREPRYTCSIILGLFENISLIYIHPHCQWRAAKFRSMLYTHDLWGGKDLYSAISCTDREPWFTRSCPKDCLLLTRVLKSPFQAVSPRDWEWSEWQTIYAEQCRVNTAFNAELLYGKVEYFRN